MAATAPICDVQIEYSLISRGHEESILPERDGPSAARTLRDRLAALFASKREESGADPELFETYQVLLDGSSGVVSGRIADLVGPLAVIVERGVARGEFAAVPGGPVATARAGFDASDRFHDPAPAPEWADPGVDDAFASLTELVVRGLVTGRR